MIGQKLKGNNVYITEGFWKLQVCGGSYLEKISLHMAKLTKPGMGDSVNCVVYMCVYVSSCPWKRLLPGDGLVPALARKCPSPLLFIGGLLGLLPELVFRIAILIDLK